MEKKCDKNRRHKLENRNSRNINCKWRKDNEIKRKVVKENNTSPVHLDRGNQDNDARDTRMGTLIKICWIKG